MKVTVSFGGNTKLVVPCSNGDLTIRELVDKACARLQSSGWAGGFSVTCVTLARDGGILDWSDRVADVLDDREMLIAQTNPPMGHSSDASQSPSPLLPTDQHPYQHQQVSTTASSPPMLPPRRGSAAASPWGGGGMNDVIVVDVGTSRQTMPQQFQHDVIVTTKDIVESPTPVTPLLVRSTRMGGPASAGRSSTPLVTSSDRLPPPPPLPPHADSDAELSRLHQQHLRQLHYQPNQSRQSAEFIVDLNAEPSQDLLNGFDDDSLPSYIIRLPLDPSSAERSPPCGLRTKPFLDSSQRSAGLEIQTIEPAGSVAKDGRLKVGDRILEINGNSLLGVSFNQTMLLLRQASQQPQLVLRIRTQSGRPPPPPPVLPKPTAAAASRNLDELARAHSQNILLHEAQPPPPPPPPPRHSRPESSGDPEVVVTSTDPSATTTAAAAASGPNAQNVRTLGNVFSVDLLKSTDGLGFSVTARDNAVPTVENPIFVKSILARGSAIRDGRLKAGDRLLEVNGVQLTGKSQSDAVSLLRSIPTGATVKLLLSRQGAVPSSSSTATNATAAAEETAGEVARSLEVSTPGVGGGGGADSGVGGVDGTIFATSSDDSEPVRTLVFDIPLNDSASAGLGVSVKGHTRDLEDSGVYIKNVMKGGAAQKDGRLQENDRLLSVNGVSLAGVDNDAAMVALRRAIRDSSELGYVRLVIARRPQLQLHDQRLASVSDSPQETGTETGSQPPPLSQHPAAMGAREARNQPRLPGFNGGLGVGQTWIEPMDFVNSQPPPVPTRPFALLPNKPTYPGAHQVISRGGGLSSSHQHHPNRKSTSVDNLLNSRVNHADEDFDPAPFVRDGVGRRSMSEKKTNVFADAKQFDFYKGLQLKKSLSDLTGQATPGAAAALADTANTPVLRRYRANNQHQPGVTATPQQQQQLHHRQLMKRAASTDSILAMQQQHSLNSQLSFGDDGEVALSPDASSSQSSAFGAALGVGSRAGHGRNSFRRAVDRSLRGSAGEADLDYQQQQQQLSTGSHNQSVQPASGGGAAATTAAPGSSTKKFFRGIFRIGKQRTSSKGGQTPNHHQGGSQQQQRFLGNSPRPIAIRLDQSVQPADSGSNRWQQQQQQQPPQLPQPLVGHNHYQVGEDLYATIIKNRRQQQQQQQQLLPQPPPATQVNLRQYRTAAAANR